MKMEDEEKEKKEGKFRICIYFFVGKKDVHTCVLIWA